MSCMASTERRLEIDLENGGTTSEEDGNKDHVLGNQQSNKLLSRVLSGFPHLNGSKFGDVAAENVEFLIDKSSGREESESREHAAPVEKKYVREKRKKTNSKRPPKPPRPPKGPSLDASDQKMVREITELAMMKRERIERVKVSKKMRAAKASSAATSLSAMAITLLFCLVIIFQGIRSRSSSSMRFEGSPDPAVTTGDALISVQYYKNPSAIEGNEPSSSLVEQNSGSVPKEEARRDAG